MFIFLLQSCSTWNETKESEFSIGSTNQHPEEEEQEPEIELPQVDARVK